MKIYIQLFAISICAITLFNDFKRDGKEHLTAKILHAIFSVYLAWTFVVSFAQLGYVITRFSAFYKKNWVEIGILNQKINFNYILLYLIISLFIASFTIRATYRNNTARIRLIYTLLFLVLIYPIQFYRGFYPENPYSSTTFIFGLGLLSGIIAYGIIAFFYSRKFMIDFFTSLPPLTYKKE